jgi:hypothetical protein
MIQLSVFPFWEQGGLEHWSRCRLRGYVPGLTDVNRGNSLRVCSWHAVLQEFLIGQLTIGSSIVLGLGIEEISTEFVLFVLQKK